MSSLRQKTVPAEIRRALVAARRRLGLTQAEVGRRVGLPQMHISKIEAGKVVPRFDTFLDVVRVLDHDLVFVPRDLVPVVESLIRDRSEAGPEPEESPLYAPDEEGGEVS